MLGLVSDTRVIGCPTVSSVEAQAYLLTETAGVAETTEPVRAEEAPRQGDVFALVPPSTLERAGA